MSLDCCDDLVKWAMGCWILTLHLTCRSKQEWANYTWLDRIGIFFPIVNWVRKYNLKQNLLVIAHT